MTSAEKGEVQQISGQTVLNLRTETEPKNPKLLDVIYDGSLDTCTKIVYEVAT